jgi:hypothetical protein
MRVQVMKPFVTKLSPEAAGVWASRLREAAVDSLDEGKEQWQPFFAMVDSLEDRARKVPSTNRQIAL